MTRYSYWQLPAIAERKGIQSLTRKEADDVPEPSKGEVLVAVKACSLNYRDILITMQRYPFALMDAPLVPLSDGAGEVVGVGEGVTRFKPGDRVASVFNPAHQKGSTPDRDEAKGGLGGAVNGMLCEYVCLPQHALIDIPGHLTFEQASTLACAAVTAQNCLFGLPGHPLKPGETAVLEGTGGVSVWGAQLAIASGARAVITSSSDAKLQRVRELFSPQEQARLTCVNYRKQPEWNKEVLHVSEGVGASHILDIGGAGTLERAFACIKPGGVISSVGMIDQGSVPNVPALVLGSSAIYRGVFVGSRETFEEMNRSIKAHRIVPLLDKVFEFNNVPQAYEYQRSGAHAGKVVIRMGQ